MDLFHMKRYWSDGEENEDEPQNEQNAEADILNKLKNKVSTVFQKIIQTMHNCVQTQFNIFQAKEQRTNDGQKADSNKDEAKPKKKRKKRKKTG